MFFAQGQCDKCTDAGKKQLNWHLLPLRWCFFSEGTIIRLRQNPPIPPMLLTRVVIASTDQGTNAIQYSSQSARARGSAAPQDAKKIQTVWAPLAPVKKGPRRGKWGVVVMIRSRWSAGSYRTAPTSLDGRNCPLAKQAVVQFWVCFGGHSEK